MRRLVYFCFNSYQSTRQLRQTIHPAIALRHASPKVYALQIFMSQKALSC
jgi:hypothetical protein